MPGAAFAIPVDGAISFAGLTDDYSEGAPASYTIKTDRTWTSSFTAGTWLRNGAATNYEVRATVTSGSLTSGTSGSWLDFTSDRTWQKNSGTCIFTLEIRDKYTTSVVKSVTITLAGV